MTEILTCIERAYQKCIEGEPLDRDSIITLLNIPVGSEEDHRLRRSARKAASVLTHDTAYLWCAIGADYQPCPLNCKFCSFGEKWEVLEDSYLLTEEEVLKRASDFIAHGADYIVLRTTEYYSLKVLKTFCARIRAEIPGDYEIIINTGELDEQTAADLADSKINGIYHALRLREGADTPFDPQVRRNTMASVAHTPLKLISLVEPVGVEHTSEELADNFLNIVSNHAVISGTMARIPVAKTPLGDLPQVDDETLAHIVAVLRLSGGNVVQDICVHPASKQALEAGANVVVIETGAIPRSTELTAEEWNEFTISQAKKLFLECGYRMNK